MTKAFRTDVAGTPDHRHSDSCCGHAHDAESHPAKAHTHDACAHGDGGQGAHADHAHPAAAGCGHAHAGAGTATACGHTHASAGAAAHTHAHTGPGASAHTHAHADDASCCAPSTAAPSALDCGCEHGDHSNSPAWLFWAAGVAALGSEIVHWTVGEGSWLVLALAVFAIFGSGLATYRAGLRALFRLDLNMNALMTVAVTGAVVIGQWPEAAMVMFLFTLAEKIEERSLARARDAVRTLMDIAPDTVAVQQADGSWVSQPVASVAVGSVLRARPGERIALDGEIIDGRATLDQSPITGESLPVEKGPGDAVYAGSINTTTLVQYRSTAPANDSKLARIIAVVEGAQASKAPTQRFVDKFARIYTPLVFVLAVAVAILPPLLGGGSWMEWVYRALVLLVIACPCALVISTPVTIVSGLAAAARIGVLVKGGAYLELGRKLQWVALDKTGTLTHGRPALTEIQVWDGQAMQAPADVATAQDWLLRAASLAALSDHPVSQALARAASEQGLTLHAVQDFVAISGQGTQGRIQGQHCSLGNATLMTASGVPADQAHPVMDRLAQSGRTVVALAVDGRLMALFGVADTLRPTSQAAIASLHALGVSTLMLSGDNRHVAQAIAREAGIDDARGEQLPEDKLQAIQALQQRGVVVGMVGDGINDAPALAQADIGFAMGAAGSDTAMETADVALMDDDLRKLPAFVALARRTAGILWQNIAIALGIKVVFLALAVTGEATMWMAVFADMGASLIVVFNGLRLLRPQQNSRA